MPRKSLFHNSLRGGYKSNLNEDQEGARKFERTGLPESERKAFVKGYAKSRERLNKGLRDARRRVKELSPKAKGY